MYTTFRQLMKNDIIESIFNSVGQCFFKSCEFQMILEQLSRDKELQCPFIRAAVAVAGLLYKQLRISRDCKYLFRPSYPICLFN